jgi:hypothetical protein
MKTWDELVAEAIFGVEAERGIEFDDEDKEQIMTEIVSILFQGDETEETLNKAIQEAPPSKMGTVEDYVQDIARAEAEYYLDELLYDR